MSSFKIGDVVVFYSDEWAVNPRYGTTTVKIGVLIYTDHERLFDIFCFFDDYIRVEAAWTNTVYRLTGLCGHQRLILYSDYKKEQDAI